MEEEEVDSISYRYNIVLKTSLRLYAWYSLDGVKFFYLKL